jgi:hypothetical protein
MATSRREFTNLQVDFPELDDDETIVFGAHKDSDGTLTLKLRLEGEWAVDQLWRGAKNAKKSVLVLSRK